jgi:hypothetical protein
LAKDLAEKNDPKLESKEQKQELETIKRHLNILDQRLDNIDSMVTAVAERVMSQPITIEITCPHCGKNVQISVIGNKRLGR